jgi:hypothetical protein
MDLEAIARRMREMRAAALRQAVDGRKKTLADHALHRERPRSESSRVPSSKPQTNP